MRISQNPVQQSYADALINLLENPNAYMQAANHQYGHCTDDLYDNANLVAALKKTADQTKNQGVIRNSEAMVSRITRDSEAFIQKHQMIKPFNDWVKDAMSDWTLNIIPK